MTNSDQELTGVRLGEYDTNSKQDCTGIDEDTKICADPIMRVGIEETIVHPKYNLSSIDQFHDIALIRLNKDIDFTDFIQPICLPKKSKLPSNFMAAGWGQTEKWFNSNIKMKVDLPLVDKDQCQNIYRRRRVSARRTISDFQLCAGGEPNKDTCAGDSGGPLMAIEDDEKWIPRWTCFGVVSYGPKDCGTLNLPGVYSNVAEYLPWIISNLKP